MKYILYNTLNPNYSTVETILTNRGIQFEDIKEYLHTTDEKHIHDYRLLGEEELHAAYVTLKDAIAENWKCLVVVDSDCDGFTSAALLINYLHDWSPFWVENYVQYVMHEGKQHGLADIEVGDFDIVIVPDAGSNDYEQHEQLANENKCVIILDHHEAEYKSEDAIVINNQLSDYPNKDLSGVGIVWQFCRYIDDHEGTSEAMKYLDLVALGLDADMMSLTSKETKHLINKGLKEITNPFFYEMTKKNSYSLGNKITPIGVAFYIAPYVNSMTRSGTMEEKILLFNSMLTFKAFDRVPSTKRGHKEGEEERIVDQAIRTVTNVKSRQTKLQNAGLDELESMIDDRQLLNHKVLLFLISQKNQIPRNIAGLIANKFMAKYQRNVAILFYKEAEDGSVTWEGSCRGYGKSQSGNFKEICEKTGVIEYAQGHANAFGIGIKDENIQSFIEKTDNLLADDSGEAVYYVDFEYEGTKINSWAISEIAQLNNLWGQDIPEAQIAVKGLKVLGEMITLMSPDKNPTLKLSLPNNISILKFKSSQEEYDKLYSETGYVEINLVGTCNLNEWNGNVTPQIFIKDYEIVDSNQYYF